MTNDRVIIAGSRSIDDDSAVIEAIADSPHTPFHGVLLTGGADGVDTIAKEYLKGFKHVEIEVYTAKWDTYGKAAGPERNKRMVRAADALIAVWDGKSPGTRDVIDKSLSAGLDVYVRVINEQRKLV